MITLFLTLFLNFTVAQAASCCGGSSVGVPLIVENERANLISRYVYSEVQDDVLTDGMWSKREGQDTYTTLKLEGSYAVQSFQLNAGVDVVETEINSQKSTGIGDSYLGLAYQYLEDGLAWYKPRVFQYFKLTFPTGNSIYESDSVEEARGKGLWTVATGIYVYKMFLPWDLTFQTEINQAFAKTFSRSDMGTYRVHPGIGSHFLIGAGWNYQSLRLGSNLDFNYEESVQLTGDIDSNGNPRRFVTWSLTTTFLIEDGFDIVATYFDQTLFGSPSNTELTRGISVGLQKKWY